MRLLKFSRSYWESAVAYGGGKVNKEILRNYDILRERESGKTIGQISIKYSLSERQIINILNAHK